MKKIDDNILAVSKAMFSNKSDWKYVTKEQKEKFFFIFNRNFSKNLPEYSFMLNNKNIDKESAMDLWYQYFISKPYPNWFWSKSPTPSVKKPFKESEIEEIKEYFELSQRNLEYLLEHHLDILKEEYKHIKKINENGKK